VLLLVPALAVATVLPVSSEHWTREFDSYFRKYTKHYFGPHVDWRWFKAQGIAESGLDPGAHSAAGAKGVMQILPSTYAEIKKFNPHLRNIEEPRWNIAAAIYYDRQMYRKWQASLPTVARLKLSFGSYNAGLGNILKAFKRARTLRGEVKQWSEVAPFSPAETRAYVARIQGLMGPER